MLWRIMFIAAFAYFTIITADDAFAASGFITNDAALWTTTDTNTSSIGTSTSSTASTSTDSAISTSSSPQSSTQSSSQSMGSQSYQSARHGYDELNRLKWTQYEDGTVISYDYDKVGNRTAKNTYASTLSGFILTATSSGYGSVVPSGTITVVSGNGQTFFIEPGPPPLPGSLLSLLIDSVAVNLGTLPSIQGPNGPRYYYTFANVTGNHTITANFSAASSPPCTNYPARLAGVTPVNHLSLSAAYNTATTGDTIQGNMFDHMESLYLDRNVAVTLDGGYACDYSSKIGNLTIKGELTVLSGTLIVVGSVILTGL